MLLIRLKSNLIQVLLFSVTILLLMNCQGKGNSAENSVTETEIQPVVVTQPTPNDSDDPAIWYNSENPEQSLILGTDKGDETGAIIVYDLDGKIDTLKSIYNLQRPNNIDVAYGLIHDGGQTDIAVFTERGRDMIRVISLPDCQFIDGGGIPVFVDQEIRSPMGIALYKNGMNEIFAVVSRKDGPSGSYLHQYRLVSADSFVKGEKVRAFGKFEGGKEIEAIAVDNELGYIYYSDETAGVRKYFADPVRGDEELAFFAMEGFARDHEGISIAKTGEGTGFIIVSDQQANKFHLFTREGTAANPHDHQRVRTVKAQTNESDGSDALNRPFNSNFPNGIFVAMSDNRTFHFYRLDDVIGK